MKTPQEFKEYAVQAADRYAKAVFRMAFVASGDYDSAQTITLEVFRSLMLSRAEPESKEKLRLILFQTTAELSRGFSRHSGGKKRIDARATALSGASGDCIVAFEKAMQLNFENRIVFHLSCSEGCSLDDISFVMNIHPIRLDALLKKIDEKLELKNGRGTNEKRYKTAVNRLATGNEIIVAAKNGLGKPPSIHAGSSGRTSPLKIIGYAVLVCAILGAVGYSVYSAAMSKRLPLEASTGQVIVRKTSKAQTQTVLNTSDLSEKTAEQIFSDYDTEIISGEVRKITNVTADVAGFDYYCAVLEIKVEHCFRGELAVDDIATVYLPCHFTNEDWAQGQGVAAAVREGSFGIFMLQKANDGTKYDNDGSVFYAMDIADYVLPDYERFAFVEIDEGNIVFSRETFKDIENTNSIGDVARYITKQVAAAKERSLAAEE